MLWGSHHKTLPLLCVEFWGFGVVLIERIFLRFASIFLSFLLWVVLGFRGFWGFGIFIHFFRENARV